MSPMLSIHRVDIERSESIRRATRLLYSYVPAIDEGSATDNAKAFLVPNLPSVFAFALY